MIVHESDLQPILQQVTTSGLGTSDVHPLEDIRSSEIGGSTIGSAFDEGSTDRLEQFIHRDVELDQLTDCYAAEIAEFVVIDGRR